MDCFIKHSLDSFKQINISYPKQMLFFLNETDSYKNIETWTFSQIIYESGSIRRVTYHP